jgi:ABC-type nitrate/sulfonate/bicarbonate transport system substrate-binding protein
MKTRLRVFLVFVGIVLGLAPIQAHAADSQPFRIAYTSIGISYGPLWLAKEAGIFKKYNIDAELLYIAGGPLSTQALIGGNVSIAFASAVALISANLSGSDLAILGSTIDTLPFQLYAPLLCLRPEKNFCERDYETTFSATDRRERLC